MSYSLGQTIRRIVPGENPFRTEFPWGAAAIIGGGLVLLGSVMYLQFGASRALERRYGAVEGGLLGLGLGLYNNPRRRRKRRR